MHRISIGLVLTLALLATSAPADAEPWARSDPKGDVRVTTFDPTSVCPGPDPEPAKAQHAASADLTGLSVRHKQHRVVVTLRYADSIAWVRNSLDVHLRTPSDAMKIHAHQVNPAAPFETTLKDETTWEYESIDEDGDGTQDCQTWTGYTQVRRCAGLRTDAAGRRITISVPRSCLGRPRWIRAGADVFGDEEGVRIADQWGTRRIDDDPRELVYGRRVRVAR
jgi:hypothetical protein